jgi:hypothetical protein
MPGRKQSNQYTRRLSREDVKSRRVLIDKSRWSLFPAPGESFRLLAAGRPFEVSLAAENCTCVPPPHQHVFLPAEAFAGLVDYRPGAALKFERLVAEADAPVTFAVSSA